MVSRPSQRLVEWLEEQLRTLSPGQRLPTDPRLAAMFGVSEITARRVVNRYRDRNLLCRIPGKGTFVAGGQEPTPSALETSATSAENIAAHILRSIHSGMLRRGQALPPVKEVVYRFQVSPASVREAYRILERQGQVTRIGRAFWVGDFTEAMAPERTRDVFLFTCDPSRFPEMYEDDPLAQAYRRMERELLSHGFVLTSEHTEDLDTWLRRWRSQRQLPSGLVFYRVLEGEYDRIWPRLARINRLAEMLGTPRPGIVVDWYAGSLRPRIAGVQILSRGTLSTMTSRVLAQYLARAHCRGASVFVRPDKYHVAIVAKLRAESTHLDPGFAFHFVVTGAGSQSARDRMRRQVQESVAAARFLPEILGKYAPVPVERFRDEVAVVRDYREAYERFGEARTWVFVRDADAAAALEWARGTKVRVPDDLALIGQQHSPRYYHLGLTCCFPDYEQIGYQVAHAIIRDFPVEQTSRGFIRTNALVAEKRTTDRQKWEPVGHIEDRIGHGASGARAFNSPE